MRRLFYGSFKPALQNIFHPVNHFLPYNCPDKKFCRPQILHEQLKKGIKNGIRYSGSLSHSFGLFFLTKIAIF
jgi:hypothetical protein